MPVCLNDDSFILQKSSFALTPFSVQWQSFVQTSMTPPAFNKPKYFSEPSTFMAWMIENLHSSDGHVITWLVNFGNYLNVHIRNNNVWFVQHWFDVDEQHHDHPKSFYSWCESNKHSNVVPRMDLVLACKPKFDDIPEDYFGDDLSDDSTNWETLQNLLAAACLYFCQ